MASQADGLNYLDGRLRRTFRRSRRTPLADSAIFKSQGVSIPDCIVEIDRGVTLIGDQSQVINDQITLTCYLDQTGKVPARGDTFTIGAEVFKVDSISEKDESAVVCIVTEGTC